MIALLFFLPDIKRFFASKFTRNKINPDIVGKVTDEHGDPLAYSRIILLNTTNEKRYSKLADDGGRFSFKVKPGKYEVHLQQFGYRLKYAPEFELEKSQGIIRLNLAAAKTEQIMIDPPVISYIEVAKAIFAALFMIGFVLMVMAFYFSESKLYLPFALCLGLLAYVFSASNFIFIKVFDHNGKSLKNSIIEIKNHRDETITKIQTDSHGRLRLVASSGFYKLTSEKTLFKTFRLNQKSIVDLDLSL